MVSNSKLRGSSEWSSMAAYAIGAIALPYLLTYWPEPRQLRLASFALLAPLVFLIPYFRFLHDESTREQRVRVLFLNAIAAAAAFAYLMLWPLWPPPPEGPFWLGLLATVVVPAVFIIAAIACAVHNRYAFASGAIATLVVWPCLAAVALWLPGPPSLRFRAAGFAGILAPLVFGIACGLVSIRPRVGYLTALLGSLLAWPVAVLREMSYPDKANSWLIFNLPDSPGSSGVLTYAKLSILTISILLVCTLISCLRLCPSSWTIKHAPVQGRIWLVALVSFLSAAIWFIHSVLPYRVPEVEHHRTRELTIAHVRKQGFHFYVTKATLLRDGQYYLNFDERRPFRYRSKSVGYRGTATRDDWERVVALADPSQLASANSIHHLEKWDDDAWFVFGNKGVRVMFESAKNPPPQELVDWLEDIEKLPRSETPYSATKDICFSFCYDPLLNLP